MLWQIYYGDFSDDDRFDEFRNKEMWDAQEIRPILETDKKFAKYQAKAKKEAILADSDGTATMDSSSSSGNGGWIFLLVLAVIAAAFVYWYKYKRPSSKWFAGGESQSLLSEQPISYNQPQ